MNNQGKILLIVAASLIALGCIIFCCVMTALHWDFSKLSTTKYETNTTEIEEAFQSISIDTSTADIIFARAQDGKCKVVCFEEQDDGHSISVDDGTLSVQQKDNRKWYSFIGINFHSPKITVYLPQVQYDCLTIRESTGDIEIPEDFTFEQTDICVSTGDIASYASASSLKISASTGHISIENICADTIDLSVSTGNITAKSIACSGDLSIKVSTGKAALTDVSCNNLVSNGSTGDMNLNHVIANGKLSVTRSTGDIHLKSCDAGELFIKTDTGDVTGSLLTEKIFITQTSTGKVDVPKSTTGGTCEITTSTGNIKINFS